MPRPALSRISYGHDQNLVVCNDSLEDSQFRDYNNSISDPLEWLDLINYPDFDTLGFDVLDNINADPNIDNAFTNTDAFNGNNIGDRLGWGCGSTSAEVSTSATRACTSESFVESTSSADPADPFPPSKKRKRSAQSLLSTSVSGTKNIVATQYLCEWSDCGQVFQVLSEFGTHGKTHTQDAKFCLWSGCTYLESFEKRFKFNKHVNLHTKPIQCFECAKRFSECSHLDKHIGTHKPASGYSVYWCPLGSACTSGFGKGGSRNPSTRLATAKQHITRCHKGCSDPPIHEQIGSRKENEKL